MERIDQLIIDHAFENSQAWFKKKYTSREVVEALFTSNTNSMCFYLSMWNFSF